MWRQRGRCRTGRAAPLCTLRPRAGTGRRWPPSSQACPRLGPRTPHPAVAAACVFMRTAEATLHVQLTVLLDHQAGRPSPVSSQQRPSISQPVLKYPLGRPSNRQCAPQETHARHQSSAAYGDALPILSPNVAPADCTASLRFSEMYAGRGGAPGCGRPQQAAVIASRVGQVALHAAALGGCRRAALAAAGGGARGRRAARPPRPHPRRSCDAGGAQGGPPSLRSPRIPLPPPSTTQAPSALYGSSGQMRAVVHKTTDTTPAAPAMLRGHGVRPHPSPSRGLRSAWSACCGTASEFHGRSTVPEVGC